MYSNVRQKQELAQQKLGGDPFADLVIPEALSRDPATNAVIENNIKITKDLYNSKPDIWETWIAIGGLRRQLMILTGRLRPIRKPLEIYPTNAIAHRNIASIYENDLHDYEQALNYYRLGLRNTPGDSEVYLAMATIERVQFKNVLGAEKTLQDGLGATNNNADVWYALAQLYKESGNIVKYRQTAKELMKAYPDIAAYKQVFADVK